MINLIFITTWVLVSTLLIALLQTTWYFIILYILAGLIAAIIMILLIVLIAVIFGPLTNINGRFKHYLTRSIARFINFWATRLTVKVIGKENIVKKGPLVVYANHKSLSDPFILLQAFNRNLSFTPKSTLYKSRPLRRWLNAIGCFPIDRQNDRTTAKNLIKAIKDVKAGLAMAVFPEGGIKSRETDEMTGIKAGSYKLALKSESVILPVAIVGNSSLSKNWPFKITRTTVIIHKPIYFDEYKHLTTLEIGQLVFSQINETLSKYS